MRDRCHDLEEVAIEGAQSDINLSTNRKSTVD
jgi:hypothetical protein